MSQRSWRAIFVACWLAVVLIGSAGLMAGFRADQHLRNYIDEQNARTCQVLIAGRADNEALLIALITKGTADNPARQRESIALVRSTFATLPPFPVCTSRAPNR